MGRQAMMTATGEQVDNPALPAGYDDENGFYYVPPQLRPYYLARDDDDVASQRSTASVFPARLGKARRGEFMVERDRPRYKMHARRLDRAVLLHKQADQEARRLAVDACQCCGQSGRGTQLRQGVFRPPGGLAAYRLPAYRLCPQCEASVRQLAADRWAEELRRDTDAQAFVAANWDTGTAPVPPPPVTGPRRGRGVPARAPEPPQPHAVSRRKR